MLSFDNMMKIILATVIFLLPIQALALSSEVHIYKDGKVSMKGVKVMQLAGPTFFTRLYWGDAFVRLTVKTNSGTVFYRATGEKTTLSEVAVEDILDLEGELEPGGSALVIIPKTVKNTSVVKEQSVLSGKVTSIDINKNSFTLESKSRGEVSVNLLDNSHFIKGNRNIDLNRLKIGDDITKVDGDYDYSNKSIKAQRVVAYVDLKTFEPKVHIGNLTAIGGTNLPTELSVNISGSNYKVNLRKDASMLNKAWGRTSLSRFVVGDTIRIWGAIREVDELIIDAEVVRNLNI
jgi:uncharacterized membrane protein